MDRYDVAVIGGGPGGYIAAIHSAKAGRKTVLIEKEALGGVCLNWGCIPTKALLRNAEVLNTIRGSGIFGITVNIEKIDYARAQERSREVSARLVKGIAFLMKKHKVTVISDTAVLLDDCQILLERSQEKLKADHVILATGSKPIKLPGLDYNHQRILDSRKALQIKKVPSSIVIIGAGAIGVEFAVLFRSYGAAVDLVEMLPQILPNEEPDISSNLQDQLTKQGIKIHTGTRLTAVESRENLWHCKLETQGKQLALSSEYILSAAGIQPNSNGLKDLGIELDNRGYVIVDQQMRTSLPSVYAIGDLTGKLALAHVASAQAAAAVDSICGRPAESINYDNMPKCTYSIPEVASAGLGQTRARSMGYDVGTAVFRLSANGKAVAVGDESGFVRLVYEKKYGQLLGVHLIGHGVTEMIGSIVGFLGLEMTIDELAQVVYPHPTVSESIMEAAHLAGGKN